MDQSRIKILIDKVLDGNASEEEQHELEMLYQEYDARPAYIEELDSVQLNTYKDFFYAGIRQRIDAEEPVKKVKLWPRVAVAAAVVGIALCVYFFNAPSRYPDTETSSAQAVVNDIAPGKNTATLTLSNGKTIQLSDAKAGVVIDASSLRYNDGSAINAEIPDQVRDDVVVKTPRGGQYQVVLPDGTHVWLNADSKIEFASNFLDKNTRNLKLTGEAYFEVAKNRKRPFIVESNGQEVTVLGTHFNINSYADEGETKTTLLEGSVRVVSAPRHADPSRHAEFISASRTGKTAIQGVEAIILKPNQQAILKGEALQVKTVNPTEAMAWKNGYFRFNGEQIESIMNELKRWYDIDVHYEGKMPEDGFNGKVSRYKNISQVLKALEAMKLVHFKIEGRRVTVIH